MLSINAAEAGFTEGEEVLLPSPVVRLRVPWSCWTMKRTARYWTFIWTRSGSELATWECQSKEMDPQPSKWPAPTSYKCRYILWTPTIHCHSFEGSSPAAWELRGLQRRDILPTGIHNATKIMAEDISYQIFILMLNTARERRQASLTTAKERNSTEVVRMAMWAATMASTVDDKREPGQGCLPPGALPEL